MSARGKSEASSILLESMTKSLIIDLNISILGVKKKGANMNILNAIFS